LSVVSVTVVALLVQPCFAARLPFGHFLLGEPERNFALGRVVRVAGVNQVAANLQTEITADRAGCRIDRLGGASEGAANLDGLETLSGRKVRS
jgi:hypothetical protein